jgi:phycocyanobilin lyase subunit alpha
MAPDAEPEFAQPLTLEEAIANLKGEDAGLRFYSAWWFGKFKVNHPEATKLLIEALKDDRDRTEEGGYPLRRNAARALGKVNAVEAVPALIEALECSDYYVVEGAAQSLELLGDARAIEPLLHILEKGLRIEKESGAAGVPSLVQLVPEQPDLSQPYDAILEALGTLAAIPFVQQIEPFLSHPTPRVQYAAARAMYQITGENQYGDRLITALQGPDLQLRRAALMDVGAIGYLPAAETIANTLAENSLKLISMKGLLEYQINHNSDGARSKEAIYVMDLMDGML